MKGNLNAFTDAVYAYKSKIENSFQSFVSLLIYRNETFDMNGNHDAYSRLFRLSATEKDNC